MILKSMMLFIIKKLKFIYNIILKIIKMENNYLIEDE